MNEQNHSEVARLLNQIREEYEAGLRGLYGLSEGSSRHRFISKDIYDRLGELDTQLKELVGDKSMAMIVNIIDEKPAQ